MDQDKMKGNNSNSTGDFQVNGHHSNPIPANKSVSNESYTTDSDSDLQPLPSRPSTAKPPGKLLDGFGVEIGDDVRMVVTLLENAGFCAPSSVPPSRPGTAGSDIPPARPSTAEKPFNKDTVEGM
jgi:hypothetical protein